MRAKIIQVGNSCGVRLPKPVVSELGLLLGSEVDLVSDNGRLLLTPVRAPREGWAHAFARAKGVDIALDAHAPTKFDEDEWMW